MESSFLICKENLWNLSFCYDDLYIENFYVFFYFN